MSGTSRHDVKMAASSDAKDKMYEPKHKKKLVRVLTVIAYVFSVSLAAITLSLFYIFIYRPDNSRHASHITTKDNIHISSGGLHNDRAMNRTWEGPEEPRALPVQIAEQSHRPSDDVAYFQSNQFPGDWQDFEAFHVLRKRKRSVHDIIKMLMLKKTT